MDSPMCQWQLYGGYVESWRECLCDRPWLCHPINTSKLGQTLHLLYSAVIYWYWSGCKTWLKVRLTNSRSIIIRANKEFDIELLSMLGIFGDIFSNAHNEWRTVHKIEHYLSIYLIIRQIRDKEFVDMSNDIWQKWKSVCIDRHSLGLRADFETKIPPWQGEL